MKRNPVIDVDGHVAMELADGWLKHFESAEDAAFMEGLILRPRSLRVWSSADMTPEQIYDGLKSRLKGAGGWEPKTRLRHMDEEGIDVAVLFGTEVCFNQEFYKPSICRSYNNWLAGYCAADPTRLRGMALLPLGDGEAAARELERCVKELGFVGGIMKPSVDTHKPDEPQFLPIYGAAEKLGVPVCFHITHSIRFDLISKYKYDYVRAHAFCGPASSMLAMIDVAFGGVLEKFPRLRVAFMEGTASWIPAWLDRMDGDFYAKSSYASAMKKLPSEYLTSDRIFYSCESDERHLPYAVKAVGEGRIVWSSDYPHMDATFPGALRSFTARTDLSKRQKARILTENPKALFPSIA